MDFGIAIPSYIEAWKDCEVAEDRGFTHAWFYDTQLLCSDVWATMALCAEHTRSMRLGTLVAVPSNRIAPVTASAAATLNALAPGRIVLGIGTGFTARNCMALPALSLRSLVDYVEQVRGLLAGEDVLYREGEAERWIRLLTRDRSVGCINLDDPIPIHIAANGPRALATAGEKGDGWIIAGSAPAGVKAGKEAVCAAAESAGRRLGGAGGGPHSTVLTSGCVLLPGEGLDSKRVMERVGPVAVVGVHAAWESRYGLGANFGLENEPVAAEYDAYIRALGEERGSPPDRRYLDVHEGHMMYLKPGEERFVAPPVVPVLTVTGDPEQVRERVQEYAEAGADNLALQVIPGRARELIDEFSEHVLAKL